MSVSSESHPERGLTVFCPTCAAELPEDSNFCPKCGRLVNQPAAAPRKGMPGWVVALIIIAALIALGLPFIALIAAIIVPNFIHARDESITAADEGNLKAIATAVEEYAVDHAGRYPDRLDELQPTYIKVLPVVPGGDGSGKYTYHHPASRPFPANYDIWDDGTMDPTTLASIAQNSGGPPKYVVYVSSKGLVGVPGITSSGSQ